MTTYPSNFEEEIRQLKKRVSSRVNEAAKLIVEEELQNILGRIKIIKRYGLDDSYYEWFLEENKNPFIVEGK